MPEGSVVADHDETGHYYKIMTPDTKGVVGNRYPSVTGKLQILKDESLINYKMNQALNYVFGKFKEFNDSNIMDHLELASRVSQDNLSDAGDIGREIHDARERIFKEWIRTGTRPSDFLSFAPPENPDIRMKSALRALSTFCDEYGYVPVAVELFVYSHRMKVAGTLDDIGLMWWPYKVGNPHCVHETILVDNIDKKCLKCDAWWKWQFVLLDLKTSNQFKDHYFFQVALYYTMFYNLTGLRPDRCFILKLSKVDGTFKMENLKRPSTLSSYARTMVRTHDGIRYIKKLRKDNQKVVGEKIEL